MIHIYDNLDRFSDQQYQFLFEQLPPSRKAKASILDGDKKKIAISEYFLLKQLLHLKDNVDFTYNENGKPRLDGYYFNFAHRDNVICIAIGETEIGVDIEKQRKYDVEFARFILNDEEFAFIETQANKDELITKLWTQKEATVKCLGLNLSISLKNIIDTKRFNYTFTQHKDYCVCQCVLNN